MTAADLEIRIGWGLVGEAAARLVEGSTHRKRLLLAAADGGVIAFVGVVAYTVRFGWPTDAGLLPFWIFAALPLAWLSLLTVVGAYSLPQLQTGMDEYHRVNLASLTLAGVIGVGCYLLEVELSRTFFLITFVGGVPLLLAIRLIRRRLCNHLRTLGMLTVPVVVAGSAEHVDEVVRALHREKWLGYRVVGALTPDDIRETPTGTPVLGSVADVAEIVADIDLEAVIFAEGSFATSQEFKRLAWSLERHSTQTIVAPALSDVSAGRLALRPIAGLPLVFVDRPHAVAASRWGKRIFDVVGSATLLLLSAPVIGLAAVAIWWEDRGPVFFRQTRVGRWGEEFECFKMRSMVVDAEARKAELETHNEGAGVLFKMTHDPRITRVGRFIRRFSIDELPQFLNVLRGDMSLVGPRPALPNEVARYDSDTTRRLDVRPGLTGLWQVSGRSNLPWDETVRLDVYYVDNWSMMADIIIIARTARAVLGSQGAY